MIHFFSTSPQARKTKYILDAAMIGVSESTVSRELRCNGGRNGGYNFVRAHEGGHTHLP